MNTALVLGATGGIGGEVASVLLRRGWRVRALNRNTEAARKRMSAVEWIQGDAMNAEDVKTAAQGASVIVHAVNPPGYRNWAELVLPMLDNTINAAKATGARILLPGTIYNYGPDAFPILSETSPQNPQTRKGAIRAEMERRLRTAANCGARVLIVRAGDFFGPNAGNNWFSQGLVKPGRPIASISYPGRTKTGHAWAYLPDLAETMIRLIESEPKLAAFETFHFGGHWDADGTAMIAAIRRVTGNPEIPARNFPWPLLTLLSPFVTLFREMREMRYLWEQPLRLDSTRLAKLLGSEQHTPLDEAVRNTLIGLSCLPASTRTSAVH